MNIERALLVVPFFPKEVKSYMKLQPDFWTF